MNDKKKNDMSKLILTSEDIYDANGNKFAYLNNPNLKGISQPVQFTPELAAELIKCKNDIVYFAETYYTIVHQDLGKIKIKLRDYQKEALRSFADNRFVILKFPRQSGKSTIFAIYVLHYLIFYDDKNIALLANKLKQSTEILGRIKVAYQAMPKWLQQGIITFNQGTVTLENGSRVSANATSSDAIRGESISLLILDEMAFVEGNTWEDFYSSIYPTIASARTSRVIIVSTPNGMNHYHEFWMKAKLKENMYIPIEINWWDVPGYGCEEYEHTYFKEDDEIEIIEVSSGVKIKKYIRDFYNTLTGDISLHLNIDKTYKIKKGDEYKSFHGINFKDNQYTIIEDKWLEETIANLGFRRFNQEFGGDFLTSSDSLISSEALRDIEYKIPIPIHKLDIYSPLMSINPALEKFTKIFDVPKENHTYIFGVDPSVITEDSDGDSLCVQVLDITTLPFQQVCVIEIPSGIHYSEIHEPIAMLGRWYYDAWLFIENNDQTGLLILENLYRIEDYENIYTDIDRPKVPGFRTDKKNRKISCLRLKHLIEKRFLKLYDTQTIAQLSTFVKKKDKYQAENGYKDDLVLSLIHALFFLADEMLFEDEIINLKNYSKTRYRELEDNRLQQFEIVEDMEEDEPLPMLSSHSYQDLEINVFKD